MRRCCVFHATFKEREHLKASFHEDGTFFAKFGEFRVVVPDPYTGEYIITPLAWDDQTLACANKTMLEDVVVLKVPYYETHNTNGLTAYIASEVI